MVPFLFLGNEPESRHSREGGNPYTRGLEEKLRHSLFAFLMALWNMDSGSPLRFGRNDGFRVRLSLHMVCDFCSIDALHNRA